MTEKFINGAKKGNPVFITDVRDNYNKLPIDRRQILSCVLNLADGNKRLFDLCVPVLEKLNAEQLDFVKSYIRAEIYNILSALGGLNMTMYTEPANKELIKIAKELNKTFDIDKDRSKRKGYGCCVNVIDRMLDAICGKNEKFEFIVKNISEKPKITQAPAELSGGSDIFRKAAQNLAGKAICGMDIGGTDIKVGIVVNGNICSLKEYDWFPESFQQAEQLTDPICILIRLVRAHASLDADKTISSENRAILQQKLTKAMHKDASYEVIEQAVKEAEKVLKNKLIGIDAIGLSFPDVVVKDKIVGGEATKTRGIRNNSSLNYEAEFKKITDLDKRLLELCKKGGVVKNINDGPMAAFTAAVEMAAVNADSVKEGVFAHTLGTELGTGWVDSSGTIPEIPLECYNFIIDLGDFVAKSYPADDARSINNVNTGLAGTLQKYASQSGVFRLGLKYFKDKNPHLYKEMFDKGFVEQRGDMLVVPAKPKDMRKAFLEYMMSLPEKENDETVRQVFRDIGLFLAITWFETQRILQPAAKARILFGRLVKKKICFDLIKQGTAARKDNLQMDVADASMANTPLMKQLEAHPEFTVAQFAQAIGAVYYGNMGLLTKG